MEVERLVKRYGPLTAVDDCSFAVERGEIFGFLGPNGAGKTTTIQILATLLPPTSGTARVGGSDVVREPFAVRRKIGIVFQDPSLDSELTAEENLRLHARLYGLGWAEYRERSERLLRMVGLADRRASKVRTFSGGMRRRLEIARGLLHHPQVLFLDEPTVGLDPQTRAAIWQHVRELRDEVGITVFMTTHYMDEAENCDRVAIMDHGRIVALDSPANLKRGLGGDVVRLRSAKGEAIAQRLAAEHGLAPQALDGQVVLRVPDAATFVPRLMAEFGREVESLEIRQPSLDEVFLALTGREIRDEELSARDAAQAAMRAHARMGARRRGG
ncbi:MAG: ATP-binding cassette domain-containing protein [Clostridia bacterium]|nr:ATP-binding cassette domain-containing protein [Clostridia bacterium]